MNGRNEHNEYVSNLNEVHIDVLREIGNIGSGNAAKALASMLKRRVDINIPIVKIMEMQELAELLGGPENQVVGILFTLHEDFQGMMMFLTERQFAHMILNVLMNKNFERFEELEEVDLSAIKEVGNIMVSAYMGAISTLTGMTIGLSPPSISIDMVGAMLNVPAVEVEKFGDKALFIQDGFIDGSHRVESYLLMIPEVGYLKKVFQTLGLEM